MKWLASALIASVILPSALKAKGLDKLQPDTEEAKDDEDEKDEANPVEGKTDKKAVPKHGAGALKEKEKGEGKDEEGPLAKDGKGKDKPGEAKEPEVPVEPGFQLMYVGTGLSLINIKGDSGTWHSSSTGDLEVGYRFLKAYRNAWDVYGTFRYRPADVTAEKNRRAFRGVTQTYLFGAKAQTQLQPKLFAVMSAELGMATAELHPIDGIPQTDTGLEKSGVDLSLGGGVSYLVLDKIALGAQIHLGLGQFKSTQFGVDIRFLL